MTLFRKLPAIILVALLSSALLKETSAAEGKSDGSANTPLTLGPFLFFLIELGSPGPGQRPAIVPKGLAIRCGTNAGVCFDTDLLRYAAVWEGGFLDLSKTSLMQSPQGSRPATVKGRAVFQTAALSGVSMDRNFSDPRPNKIGPLPRPLALRIVSGRL